MQLQIRHALAAPQRRQASADFVPVRAPRTCVAQVDQAKVRARRLRHEKSLLKQIEAALARLNDGSYGCCTGCGGEIAAQRLHTMPYAAECADCAANSKSRK